MTTISERINLLKDHYKLSSRGLASLLDMPSATVTNYVNGTKSPSYEFLVALLTKYVDISAEWLLRGEGSMFRDMTDDTSELRRKYETELLVKDGVIKELRSIILEKNQNKQAPERQQLVG